MTLLHRHPVTSRSATGIRPKHLHSPTAARSLLTFPRQADNNRNSHTSHHRLKRLPNDHFSACLYCWLLIFVILEKINTYTNLLFTFQSLLWTWGCSGPGLIISFRSFDMFINFSHSIKYITIQNIIKSDRNKLTTLYQDDLLVGYQPRSVRLSACMEFYPFNNGATIPYDSPTEVSILSTKIWAWQTSGWIRSSSYNHSVWVPENDRLIDRFELTTMSSARICGSVTHCISVCLCKVRFSIEVSNWWSLMFSFTQLNSNDLHERIWKLEKEVVECLRD